VCCCVCAREYTHAALTAHQLMHKCSNWPFLQHVCIYTCMHTILHQYAAPEYIYILQYQYTAAQCAIANALVSISYSTGTTDAIWGFATPRLPVIWSTNPRMQQAGTGSAKVRNAVEINSKTTISICSRAVLSTTTPTVYSKFKDILHFKNASAKKISDSARDSDTWISPLHPKPLAQVCYQLSSEKWPTSASQ